MHQVVVQHHVSGRQTLQSANRDEIRIPWSGADQIDDALCRKNLAALKPLSLKPTVESPTRSHLSPTHLVEDLTRAVGDQLAGHRRAQSRGVTPLTARRPLDGATSVE